MEKTDTKKVRSMYRVRLSNQNSSRNNFFMKTIGILGIQGAIEEHEAMLQSIGCNTRWVKESKDLRSIDGIILPGGESTSMGKQLEWSGLMEPLRKAIAKGMPAFGTCAGMILLAKELEGNNRQSRLGLMNIVVKRNAYGSQLDSFVTDLQIKGFAQPLPAVFIRAPRIEACGEGVETLASYKEHPVLVRQGNMMAASFHPELTDCTELHRYFAEQMVSE